ncbi:cysteine desulfuration protein SufE [Vibrio europaeus]|uniref:Cysteine desulfuration protein SufE n=1 Tax=Vibrio europaeus TaxID=300876 RepID=A0AAE7AW18_9VIBR|nr:cysteine desulfuration protein SufE [Vibrio europaeus]MDC5806910.1 cysteine desulfuration protein SufE [Vibrio europaeus]MDC5809506.1 cysteine desulfuration protein SufE [Vibrio europaeus]MDC5827435.1 cysteine desulfuration protein SufE [Vibrio europaeus]MDC5830279.1 cysteine desulfuration protein SufE [Vibrio europaeus]MDC5837135.1 cysteine desulfuration protein SufE [Vibrio europaeus]
MMTPEKVIRNFNRCVDWEERYLYLIELGERLEDYPTENLDYVHLVAGCQSQVWVCSKLDEHGKIALKATSDSSIVKGVLSLVLVAYNNQSAEDVLSFDIHTWFEELDLKSHLTPGRTQGLEAIVKSVRNLAYSYQQGTATL